MLRRIESEHRAASLAASLETAHSEPIVSAVGEPDLETPFLPHDHPPWVKDTLTLSRRAREIIAGLPRVAVKILSFWDHRIRSIVVSGTRLSIDPSGSYRCE